MHVNTLDSEQHSQPTDWQAFDRDIACLLTVPPVERFSAQRKNFVQERAAKISSSNPRPSRVLENLEVQQRWGAYSLRQYRNKAEQLKNKARGDANPFSRAALENLAQSYLVLIGYEERRQLDLKEKAWICLAHENGWRCACGCPIPYRDRELYFQSNLCSACFQKGHAAPAVSQT